MDRKLLEAISNLVRGIHPEALDRLEAKLTADGTSTDSIRLWSLELPQKSQREAVGGFAVAWKAAAAAREAVLAAVAALRFAEDRRTQAEVCWSGPISSLQGFRSTAEAYRELISSARHSAMVLSFALGEVEHLRVSLEDSIGRGVAVRMILEDFNVFTQESWKTQLDALGPTVLSRASIFVWPTSKRRQQDGRIFGSMHVKCLIVDDAAMLLTSANWSGAAMQDNMELGVVLRNRDVVRSVVEHFDHLLTTGVLVPCP